VTDLIGGRVQVIFDTFAASIEFVRAGKLRALAVTTATRSPARQTSHLWAIFCRATMRARGWVSAHQ
jgi:tripartite-type tricarboxylate transporter receptor subunit TctC